VPEVEWPAITKCTLLQTEDIDFDKLDSRIKMTKMGSTLTKEQCEIELERRNSLEKPLTTSLHGPPCHQTFHTYHDRIVMLTDKGLYNLFHLTWQAYLGHLE